MEIDFCGGCFSPMAVKLIDPNKKITDFLADICDIRFERVIYIYIYICTHTSHINVYLHYIQDY